MDTGSGTQSSVILNDVEITGTIKCAGSIRVDGKINGEIQSGANATIGKDAVIKGNIAVNSVSVAGSVNGNISAKDRIEMKSTARVTGDIKAKRLTVEDGVTFVGKSEVNPAGMTVSTPQSTEKRPSRDVTNPPSHDEVSKGSGKGALFGKRT